LIQLGVAVLIAAIGGPNVTPVACLLAGSAVVIVLGLIFAWRDSVAVAVSGDRAASPWWCFLLVPFAYLFARAHHKVTSVGLDWALPIASLVAFAVVLAAGTSVVTATQAANTVFDQATAQNDMATWLQTKASVTATVQCPATPSMSAGTTFQCIATTSDGTPLTLYVTVEDSSGTIQWTVLP
jgi:hypothetical protein